MPLTYTAIATVTVTGSTQASLEFTNIPATYTDLEIVYSTRTTRNVFVEAIYLEFNGSGGTAYSDRLLFGTGVSVLSNSSASQANINNVGITAGDTATVNTFGNGKIYIPNYASSNNKSTSANATGETNGQDSYIYANAGLWANSAAITSIKLVPVQLNNFKQYSTATLYGILKA